MYLKTILVISACLASVDNKLVFKPENFYKTCHFNKVDFWKFYYWMFQNYDHMEIATFEIEHESVILQRFLNEILASVSDHGLLQKSFTVKKHVVLEDEMEEKRNYCPEVLKLEKPGYLEEERRLNRICQDDKIEQVECPPAVNTTKIQFVTLEEILAEVMAKVKPRNESDIQQRIRSFSCDQNYRYLILVQNENDLNVHLKRDWTRVFPNPRAIFVIMFVSGEELPAEKIQHLFSRLWEDYDVFNLIISQPCVCNYRNLYSYDPYYKKNNTWGLLQKFKVDEGINEPEKYRRSLVDLNDHPLKVSIFPRIPTSINRFPNTLRENPIYTDLDRSLGYVGIDGMIMKTLTELLRLVPEMSTEESDFGYITDGKSSGSLGEIANRTLDISFNSRFVEGVGLDVIEYLTPVINDQFCIVVPKAAVIPQYLTIFTCFTWRSWLIIFVIYLGASFYWFLVRPIEFDDVKRQKDLFWSYLEVFCLFISIPIILMVNRHHQRVFFVACMLFNIVLIGCFQGTLVKSFSTTSHYSDINTLEDFDQSGLNIISSSQGVQNLFGNDGSEFSRRLGSRIQIIPKLTNIFYRVAHKRDIATADRKADATLKIEMNYKTRQGSLIHIAKECPRSYHYTYIVPKGSPYVHVFNIIITVLREAGLLLKWNSDITHALIVEKKYMHRNTEEPPPNMEQPFNMDDMRFSFYVIIGGNSLAIFVFILELILNTNCFKKLTKHTFTKKQKPDYTKKEPQYTKKEPEYTKKEPNYTKKEPDQKPKPRIKKKTFVTTLFFKKNNKECKKAKGKTIKKKDKMFFFKQIKDDKQVTNRKPFGNQHIFNIIKNIPIRNNIPKKNELESNRDVFRVDSERILEGLEKGLDNPKKNDNKPGRNRIIDVFKKKTDGNSKKTLEGVLENGLDTPKKLSNELNNIKNVRIERNNQKVAGKCNEIVGIVNENENSKKMTIQNLVSPSSSLKREGDKENSKKMSIQNLISSSCSLKFEENKENSKKMSIQNLISSSSSLKFEENKENSKKMSIQNLISSSSSLKFEENKENSKKMAIQKLVLTSSSLKPEENKENPRITLSNTKLDDKTPKKADKSEVSKNLAFLGKNIKLNQEKIVNQSVSKQNGMFKTGGFINKGFFKKFYARAKKNGKKEEGFVKKDVRIVKKRFRTRIFGKKKRFQQGLDEDKRFETGMNQKKQENKQDTTRFESNFDVENSLGERISINDFNETIPEIDFKKKKPENNSIETVIAKNELKNKIMTNNELKRLITAENASKKRIIYEKDLKKKKIMAKSGLNERISVENGLKEGNMIRNDLKKTMMVESGSKQKNMDESDLRKKKMDENEDNEVQSNTKRVLLPGEFNARSLDGNKNFSRNYCGLSANKLKRKNLVGSTPLKRKYGGGVWNPALKVVQIGKDNDNFKNDGRKFGKNSLASKFSRRFNRRSKFSRKTTFGRRVEPGTLITRVLDENGEKKEEDSDDENFISTQYLP